MFEDEVWLIELAAPLHDIGRLRSDAVLLLKPAPLTEEETAITVADQP